MKRGNSFQPSIACSHYPQGILALSLKIIAEKATIGFKTWMLLCLVHIKLHQVTISNFIFTKYLIIPL